MKEPEDGGQRTAPSYLYSSLLGVQDLELVLAEVEVINIQLDWCHAPNRFGTVNMEDNINIE